jgi:hypothetical protein
VFVKDKLELHVERMLESEKKNKKLISCFRGK